MAENVLGAGARDLDTGLARLQQKLSGTCPTCGVQAKRLSQHYNGERECAEAELSVCEELVPSFSFCVHGFLTVSNVDAPIFRYMEVVVVVWLIRVLRVSTYPDSIGPHSLNSKVSLLNILVDVGVWRMLYNLAGIDVNLVGCSHTHRLDG